MGGLIVDTSVIVHIERSGTEPDFSTWRQHEPFAISAITVSELHVGVHRAVAENRRQRRLAFIERLLASVTVLPFDTEVAIVHARLSASLSASGKRIGAHDLLIAATAITHQCDILTANTREFSHVPGLQVLAY